VHYLDVGGIPVADAKGLETVLKGIKEKARDDDALLAEAMRILDLFIRLTAKTRRTEVADLDQRIISSRSPRRKRLSKSLSR